MSMKIDIHSHTERYSPCSIISPPELVMATLSAGLDGLVITEHNRTWPARELRALRDSLDLPEEFFLASGQEVDTDLGHVLIYGCNINFGINRHWREVIRITKEERGAAVLAHPFRWMPPVQKEDFENFLLEFDAIEVMSANLNREAQEYGLEKAGSLGIPQVGGSDAHAKNMAGTYYTNFIDPVNTIEDLVRAIKTGRIKPGKLEDRNKNR
ncbi:MAG: PHP domain-containing protein [Candidatus Eremiobacteraeota bacterium]|nr:PHP domain-containing protein [Candidatus Eremiobacteraeota bacterium]